MVGEREKGASQARLVVLDQKAAITSGSQEVKRRDTELGPPAHWMTKKKMKRGQPSKTRVQEKKRVFNAANDLFA